MENSEKILLDINKQLNELNKKFTGLQDIILNMKNEFEILKKWKIQENSLLHLTKSSDENLQFFLDNRAQDCKVLNECTTLIEKLIFRVLRTYADKGSNSALAKINQYMKMLETNPGVKLCPNNECLKNAANIFILLKDLINASNELSIKYSEELIVLEQTSKTFLEFENEEEINDLLKPLSNVVRLKILKNLSKGGKFYSQLEVEIGIKAGHLLFHIEKLIKAKYVKQEDKKYLITLNGLKALRFLHGLKEELSILI